jgi:thiopurine S-methyltransferase
MNESFWHKCWERNSLGFHQETVHPFLEQYLLPLINESGMKTQQHVFVPLCGKSLDMVWLAEHMKVTGAELSEIACRDFFLEKGLDYRQENEPLFNRFSYDNVELWQGDFFKSTPQLITNIDWIYDRAALIALP